MHFPKVSATATVYRVSPIFPAALPGYVALGKFKKLVVKGLAVAG
jgi:hypothetical protein